MKKKLAVLFAFLLCTTVIYPVVAEEIETETTETETTEATEVPEATENPEVEMEAPEVRSGVDVTDDFTDPVLREFVVENYGTDGVVLDTDLAGVSSINARDMGIQSLDGIQHFVSIVTIDFAGNDLGDLSFENFPASALNVYLADANITSIDTTGGENIRVLTLTKNPFPTIDLAPLTSLYSINMSQMSREFTTVDFSVAPWIEGVTLKSCWIVDLDLSMLDNLESLMIGGSGIRNLKLPSAIDGGDMITFMIENILVEHVDYAPATATSWRTNSMRPLKEIKINAEGYPYIELHEDSVITNLDTLNANGEDFVYDAAASTLTWVASQDAQEFYDQFNREILFSNSSSTTRAAAQPLTGYYIFFPLPAPPTETIYHTVNFLDCDGEIVAQAWPADGDNATAPSGYSYDASTITNITFSKDVSPLNCSAGFAIPNTGR